jgi:hypothetical protein
LSRNLFKKLSFRIWLISLPENEENIFVRFMSIYAGFWNANNWLDLLKV